jgi:thiol-disulfide isomerase/thioredoxin
MAAIQLGQAAPQLVAKELDGTAFDLSTLKGKTVLVHFWATWCAPCKEEMPILDGFYKRYQGQGVELIAVSLDRSRARDEVEKFMKNLSFPAAMSGDLSENGFGNPPVLPITYVVDKTGKISSVLSPAYEVLSEQTLIKAVSP